MIKRIVAGIALIALLINLNACGQMNQVSYSEKVMYNAKLQFPDFDLIYLGQREEGSLPYAPEEGFIYDDFEISDGDSKQTISWSLGTGDIGPTPFEFNGKEFLLEKDRSDIFDELGYNEIVVWERENYEKELSKKRMN